jgi:hypothetical protein
MPHQFVRLVIVRVYVIPVLKRAESKFLNFLYVYTVSVAFIR